MLKDDALPTIFDTPSQSQNGQVKRGKETVGKINSFGLGKNSLFHLIFGVYF